jgi:hypothetical protein
MLAAIRLVFGAILRASSRVSSFAAVAPAGLILEIDVSKFLSASVFHDKAGV